MDLRDILQAMVAETGAIILQELSAS
jgi:hypothetical protein